MKPKYNHLPAISEQNILPYPSLLTNNQFDYVYRPGNDTYMMLSVLKEQMLEWNQQDIVCEVGSGSGLLSANICKYMQSINKQPLLQISIDMNIDASILSQSYYELHSLPILQINTSLLNNVRVRPSVIVFNPPYIPVSPQQMESEQKYLAAKLKYVRENHRNAMQKDMNLIAYSYMGGEDGLQTTRKLIQMIAWDCLLYIVVMGEEGVQKLMEELQQREGRVPSVQVLKYNKFYNQHLYILKLIFKQ